MAGMYATTNICAVLELNHLLNYFILVISCPQVLLGYRRSRREVSLASKRFPSRRDVFSRCRHWIQPSWAGSYCGDSVREVPRLCLRLVQRGRHCELAE